MARCLSKTLECIAQMVAAQIFNQSTGRSKLPVFGCVTTGEIWQFPRLKESVVSMDERCYYLDDVGSNLAVIQLIVTQDIALLA